MSDYKDEVISTIESQTTGIEPLSGVDIGLLKEDSTDPFTFEDGMDRAVKRHFNIDLLDAKEHLTVLRDQDN